MSMNTALLFVGLTFIVAMACALSDPIPGSHQPPHPPKNWVWPTGVLVTLAAVPVTDGVAIPTEREYCALRGMALPRWSSRRHQEIRTHPYAAIATSRSEPVKRSSPPSSRNPTT
jgi:hypothetical protein